MTQRIARTLFTAALVSATIAAAQSATSKIEIPVATHESWQAAQLTGPSKGKLVIVTLDRPRRRQTCHVQSFTPDKLVCSRAIGGPRTYRPEQVLALILPGDDHLKLPLWLGFNGGLGVAIWGTGIAALICFGAAGAIAYADDRPDRLLYLAPGRELSGKLGQVQP